MAYEADDGIAVIGLAGRLPGAADLDEFWRNVSGGFEAVRFPSDDELRAVGVPDRLLTEPTYVKAVVEAGDLEMFDAGFFGFSPRDAAVLDPQIRLFLEVGHSAIEDAGYDPERMSGVGVFAAAGMNRYLDMHVRTSDELETSSTGGLALGALSYSDYVATHFAYRFGFDGPAMTVSTACSSSAVAVHLACQALRAGECDFAVAGGAELEMPAHHGYRYDPGGAMSPDGHCRPFDRSAGGTVFASGGAAVLLKRLSDAIADGDRIAMIVRSSSASNDGSAKAGFSAPSVAGHAAAVREAMILADVTASDMSYVEAHATGTVLGDPIEVAALTRAYRTLGAGPDDAPIPLSSVKGNIGHLGHASGVASLIKIALCLRHERRAPTANFVEANPRCELSQTPFSVHAEELPWQRSGRPRIAGLSSLGIGGTNVHLIVEEGPQRPVARQESSRPRVVVWSARDEAAADEYRHRLAARFSADSADFAAVVATLQTGRTAHPVRGAVVAGDAAEALDLLRTAGQRTPPDGSPREVVFAFPGQAAQHSGMAVGLYTADNVFRSTMDECFDLFAQHGGNLKERWLSDARDDLVDTSVAQPLLFAVQYSLARMWQFWGIRPTAVLGHSLGELTAATVAGVLQPADAADLVMARATAMAGLPDGGMLAVAAGVDQLTPLLPDGVVIATVNGPRQTVLAGARDRVTVAERAVREAGLRCRWLPTSHAFHSPLMEPAADKFGLAFHGVRLAEPAVRFLSSAAGGDPGPRACTPEFYVEQLTRPARLDLALDALFADGRRLLLEIGPRQTLTQLARGHRGVRDGSGHAIPSLPAEPGDDDHHTVLAAAAELWTEGHPVDWEAVRQEPFHRVSVPGYPYQRSRHWLPLRGGRPETTTRATEPSSPSSSNGRPSPLSRLSWVEQPRTDTCEPGAGAFALVLVPEGLPAVHPALLSLQQAGYRPALVRPGTSIEEVDGEFRARLDDPAEVDRVLAILAARGAPTALVVHALCLSEPGTPDASTMADELSSAYHSVSALAKGAARHGVGRLLVLATRSADLTGTEPLDPARAALHATIRSLAREAPELGCRLIDLAEPVSEQDLAEEILGPATGPAETVVVLRHTARWIRVELPRPGPPPSIAPLRRGGVYLLTGGLGGLGMEVADVLAATGLRPTLVLLGRSAGTPTPASEARLEQFRRLGATVDTVACDVTDARALSRAFDLVRARHGQVNGVLHLAGTPGGGLMLVRSRADADAVLAPKVTGTLALFAALADQPRLDFLVYFSSRAAVDGLVGSADYATANAFQDAHARLLHLSGQPATSINWPAWHTVGMAAEPAEPAGRDWETVLDPANHPVLDEHRIGSVPVLPGTAHLDFVIRAHREVIGAATPLALSDVVFQRVLVARGPRRLRVRFAPAGDGWRFTVSSVAADGAGSRVAHVTGAVRSMEGAGAPADLAGLRTRLAHTVPDADSDSGLVTLGPRWDVIRRIAADGTGAGERLVELTLPAAFHADLAVHPLHPSLLDAATAAARPSHAGSYLPFSYESLRLYRDLPAELVGHLRPRPEVEGLLVADLDLYDTDGTLLAQVEGFVMRQVTESDALLEAAPVEDHSPAATAREGISPRQGARLLLDMIGGRTSAQLTVRPHRGGLPVPIADAQAAPPPPAGSSARPAGSAPIRPGGDVTAPNATPAKHPRDLSARLAELWTVVLGVENPRPTDDFLRLGGNSLGAVELRGLIQDKLGIRLSIVDMFDNSSLAAMTEALAAAAGADR